MAKIFNGITYFDCNEMSEQSGDSAQSWRRQARLGKVPAISYRRKWYFDPKKVNDEAVTRNNFAGENVENELQQGAKDGIFSGLE